MQTLIKSKSILSDKVDIRAKRIIRDKEEGHLITKDQSIMKM